MLPFRSLMQVVFSGMLFVFILGGCGHKKEADLNLASTALPDLKLQAPDFELKSTKEELVRFSDYQNKILVIHIATTWCPYCNAEAPYLEQLSRDYKDKGVEVIIIDVKEPKELVQDKLVEKFNLSFPVLLDKDGLVAASFAPADVLPELSRDEIMLASNIIIDRKGKIRFMSLLDTKNFDTKLVALKAKLDEIL